MGDPAPSDKAATLTSGATVPSAQPKAQHPSSPDVLARTGTTCPEPLQPSRQCHHSSQPAARAPQWLPILGMALLFGTHVAPPLHTLSPPQPHRIPVALFASVLPHCYSCGLEALVAPLPSLFLGCHLLWEGDEGTCPMCSLGTSSPPTWHLASITAVASWPWLSHPLPRCCVLSPSTE